MSNARSLFSLLLCLGPVLAGAGVAEAAPSMPSRPALAQTGVAGPFYAPSGASPLIDLTAAFSAKRAAPAEERTGLIRVSLVEDFSGVEAPLSWIRQPDGSAVARFTLRSAGAVGLRARLVLPRNAGAGELRVAGSADTRVEWMPVRGTEAELWTPYTEGESQTIELRVTGRPPGASPVAAGIGSLMHFDRSPFQGEAAGLSKEASGSCNVDVKCTSTINGLNAALDERKRSVAHLQFRSGGSGFICTGTLINSEKFPRAFLLTANHCMSTAAEAASLTTFWFFENAACGQRDTGAASRVQLPGGAQMVFTNYMVDSSLLELNGVPPSGTVYAGWNAADLADNTPVVSVSHPRGDPMKYAEGTVTEPRVRVSGFPLDMYGVSFTRGVIEGGSSGSGLFTLSQSEGLQLRGILSGSTIRQGGLSCSNLDELALYGRFEAFYPTIRPMIMNASAPAADIDSSVPGPHNRPITPGSSVPGAINYPGDVDVFQITVSSPGYLTVYSTGGNDLAGALLDGEGRGLVAEDDVESRNNEFGFTWRITQPGVYYVSVSHWDPTAGGGNYEINARFSAITSGNFSDIWWNSDQSGWGLALNHQDNVLAGALYTYDLDRLPLFLVLTGAVLQPTGEYLGNLELSSGPAFNTTPWPAGQVQRTVVGTMRLAFTGKDLLSVDYTVNGTQVSRNLTRLAFGKAATCTFNAFDRSYATNFQDIWWNPNESGWGLNIIHQGDVITAGLYTYDPAGRNAWYLMAPGTRQSGTFTYSGPLKRYNGPPFATPGTWPAPQEETVGNMSIAFASGNQGTLTYTLNGVQVVKTIQRQTFGALRTECSSN